MKTPITIDGRQGEGGGQVLRSSLALSLCTQTPIRIEHIRAGRRKPGLMRQHLACVRAAAAICGKTSNARLGDTDLDFEPADVISGEYRFAVGSAGSAVLVLQTVLMPLLLADGASQVRIEGGTHNAWAPPFDFLQHSFLPQLRAMGAQIDLDLDRIGFYPAGGGAIVAHIHGIEAPCGLHLIERGSEAKHGAVIRCAHLPDDVAQREWDAIRRVLHWDAGHCSIEDHPESTGPGNSVHVILRFANVTEVASSFGSKGRGAKQVGMEAAKDARRYLAANAPVGRHLADQLLLPMALIAGGQFRTLHPTKHLLTNIEIINAFLPRRITTTENSGEDWRVKVTT